MTATVLLARVVLEDARALGLDLADLIAAADGDRTVPTIAQYVSAVDATFTPSTASTYRPYWRLVVELHG